MKFEDYEQIESNVKDIRFGVINIFMRLTDYEDLVMEKYHKSTSAEDHEFNILQAEQRMKLEHPSLLRMIGSVHDKTTWESRSYFVYPNQDLFDHQSSVNNPAEIMRFLTQLLEVLVVLKDANYIHGDIRPEFIYYNRVKQRYILLDRLSSGTGSYETQKNLMMYPENLLYMSPEMFEDILHKRPSTGRNLFKSEVFSLGMVLLSMFLDPFELEMFYNKYTRRFDRSFFRGIVLDMKNNVFSGNVFNEQISNFLFDNMLCLDQERRLGPRQCADKLKNEIAPLMLKELEKFQANSKMGLDNTFSIHNEDEFIKRIQTNSIDQPEPSLQSSGHEQKIAKDQQLIDDLVAREEQERGESGRNLETSQKLDEEFQVIVESKDFIDKFDDQERPIELDEFESFQQSTTNQMFYDTGQLNEFESKIDAESNVHFGLTSSSKLGVSEASKLKEQNKRESNLNGTI